MNTERRYPQWRQAWPEMIVGTQTDAAVNCLQRYYAVDNKGNPRFTGSRFEEVAALNTDPNTLGPADFVAVSMLSVNVPAEAAIRLLGRDAAVVSELLGQLPTDVDIVDVDPRMFSAGSAAGRLWDTLRQARDGLGPRQQQANCWPRNGPACYLSGTVSLSKPLAWGQSAAGGDTSTCSTTTVGGCGTG